MKGERLQRCRVVDGETTLERGQMAQVSERSGLLGTPKLQTTLSLLPPTPRRGASDSR